jgi:hypothetical protein
MWNKFDTTTLIIKKPSNGGIIRRMKLVITVKKKTRKRTETFCSISFGMEIFKEKEESSAKK